MPKSGKKSILMVQRTSAAEGAAGSLLGHLTEHSHSKENELQSEQTKFGRIVVYGNSSESFDITAYHETSDAGQNAVVEALDNEEQIKLWEINTELNENGKHDALFAYCLVENTEKSSPTDGFEELTSTLQVYGKSQKGELDPLPPEVIEFAQYGFETPGETTGEFPNQQDAVPAE
ncbi:phage major tail protein, TP901-1 family [Jeotgalibacillus haloalkalitolerans]|uniref:Phage major tail protein, TP901-1 family n=1 Tax=Jeotgalibacillus haloalkalitolerans TaxID=3104292 RepID=A0ABU5KKH3_9BACL|nr:phage major tail protein, TP901-1 family [Jeotgalibacillus sp. HH7-29]MDZ5711662.1 phage major tail protein, TP901-1 family [Jeotgalibacillus sp. HH7-29]